MQEVVGEEAAMGTYPLLQLEPKDNSVKYIQKFVIWMKFIVR